MKQIIVLFLRKNFIVYDVRKIDFQIKLLFSIEITKDQCFQRFIFEFLKNHIINIISDEYDIFLDENV